MANVKKFTDVLADIKAKGDIIKSAATAKAAGAVPSVPEKDPQDKGTVSIPKDPNAAASVQNLPENKTNADATPVVAPPPAKVVEQPEKVAGLTAKAANLLKSVQSLRKVAGSGTASAISTNGSLPSDAGNDNKPKQTLDAPKAQPGTQAGKADPAVKDAGKDGMPKDKQQAPAPMPKGDGKGELPAEGTNTNDTQKGASVETDPDLDNIGPDFYVKLAKVTLQFEEGRAVMEACLKKAHGAEHATNLIKTAMFMEQRMQELEAIEQSGEAQAEAFWKSASVGEREGLIKLANTHETAMASFTTPQEQEAYLEGAKIAAAMADAGAAGEQPPPGVPGMGGEGDPAGAAGAEGGEVSDEDIIQALQMLVQEGKITEQDAEAILQQLLGGAEGGAPGDAGAGAGGPPPEAAGGAEPPKPKEDDKEAGAAVKTVGAAVDAFFASLNKA